MIDFDQRRLFFSACLSDIEVDVYGSPVTHRDACDSIVSLETALRFRNTTPGYFVIRMRINQVEYIINDIFANYRVYYSHPTGVVTDQFPGLHTQKKNIQELKYFYKKGYTSAFGTVDKNISKLPPLGYLIVNEENIQLCYSHLPFDEKLSSLKYELDVRERISSTINHFRDADNIFVFLSGGIDSIYLCELLLSCDIKFTAVFIKYEISDRDNAHDFEKTNRYCRRRGIRLEVIHYGKGDDVQKYMEIVREYQPIDHSFYSFYKAVDVLKQKYGIITIINGQSSDSIFCWGISGENLSSKLQRFLFADIFFKLNKTAKNVIYNMYTRLYRFRYGLKRSYKIPLDDIEYNCALNFPIGYVPLLDQDAEFITYLTDHLSKQWVDDPKVRLIYSKLNYLQGSSNQMPIHSARYSGHRIVLPFLDPKLIQLIYHNQNTLKRIFNPRYELKYFLSRDILRDIRSSIKPNIPNHVDEMLPKHRIKWLTFDD